MKEGCPDRKERVNECTKINLKKKGPVVKTFVTATQGDIRSVTGLSVQQQNMKNEKKHFEKHRKQLRFLLNLAIVSDFVANSIQAEQL